MSSAAAQPVPSPSAQKSATVQGDHERTDEEARWRPVLGLLCDLTAELPLPGWKVSNFLELQVGSVVPTSWRLSRDVPLRANGTLIAWGELEGAGARLAVRVTELA